MAHELYIPDNHGYRHTLRMCNIYCFSTTTMVTGTRLNCTLTHTLRFSFVLLLAIYRHFQIYAVSSYAILKKQTTNFVTVRRINLCRNKSAVGWSWRQNLLTGNTGDGAIMLRLVSLPCVGVWIPVYVPCI